MNISTEIDRVIKGFYCIKILSFHYRHAHYKDKTVSHDCLIFNMGIPYLERQSFILRLDPVHHFIIKI